MSFLSGIFGGGDKTPLTGNRDHQTSADIFNSATFNTSASSSSYPSFDSSGNLSSSAGSSSTYPASTSTSSSTSAPSSTLTPSSPSSSYPSALPSASDTLSGAYADPASLHPLAGLGKNLDFLQLEEDKLQNVEGAMNVLPSRGWTDDLCVGTGTTYVSGLAVGGVWGLKEGLGRQLGPNPAFKLRLNSVLNAATRRGTLLGNSLGVLAMFYNIANSSLDSIRGKHDVFNSMGAAALSGAVFKSTSGMRPAAMSAGLMASAAGAWSGFKRLV